MRINYKRLQLKVAAAEMYPADYDFSIILIPWKTGRPGIRWTGNSYPAWK